MSISALAQSLNRGEILLPRLKQFLAKERAALESNGMRDRDVVITDAMLSVACFTARAAEYNHRERLEGQYFHPSALGVCLRKMWFGQKGAPPNGDPSGTDLLRSHMIFEMGTYLHVLFQNLCERAGYLKAREVAIRSRKRMLLGHGDGILEIDGERYLLEFKTVNSRGFTMVRDKPHEGYIKQVTAYMRVLKLKKCILVYVNKDNGMMKEFLVLYDRNFYLKQVKTRIRRYFRYVDANEVPKREGPQANLFPCNFCEFSRVCWDTYELKKWMKKTGAKFPANETKKKKTLYGAN